MTLTLWQAQIDILVVIQCIFKNLKLNCNSRMLYFVLAAISMNIWSLGMKMQADQHQVLWYSYCLHSWTAVPVLHCLLLLCHPFQTLVGTNGRQHLLCNCKILLEVEHLMQCLWGHWCQNTNLSTSSVLFSLHALSLLCLRRPHKWRKQWRRKVFIHVLVLLPTVINILLCNQVYLIMLLMLSHIFKL